ncbi:MAG: phosphate/phosphite/phosphonate ABC transporter substrate-binding protein [Acidiferrobacterales bacterium]
MQYRSIIRVLLTGLVAAFINLGATVPAAAAVQEYIFSAPPRGAPGKEAKVYGPIATYLSRVTGKKIVYKHPGNWLNYQNDMQQGRYDLVFDGPHFIGWRISKTQHQPLAKLPGSLAFVVFVKNDNKYVERVGDLAGRTICGLAPPNLATLTMYNQFLNPARQPLVIEVKSFPVDYKWVQSGKCVAGVMRDKAFNKLQKKHGNLARVVWSSRGTANQGFTAGPRFSAGDKKRIVNGLLSPDAAPYLDNFYNRFSKKNKSLQQATASDYVGLSGLLQGIWGFDQ